MPDLVGNLEDRISRVAAQIILPLSGYVILVLDQCRHDFVKVLGEIEIPSLHLGVNLDHLLVLFHNGVTLHVGRLFAVAAKQQQSLKFIVKSVLSISFPNRLL